MCGKRLATAIRDNADLLHTERRLGIPADHWNLLVTMSPASIDRHLKARKEQNRLHGISHTNATTALKNRIPIRTGPEWRDVGPGHFQIDTVGHDGGSGYGQFCITLNGVDVCTGWTEPRALLNKAKRWVVESITDIARPGGAAGAVPGRPLASGGTPGQKLDQFHAVADPSLGEDIMQMIADRVQG
jgi:hypothetical protein